MNIETADKIVALMRTNPQVFNCDIIRHTDFLGYSLRVQFQYKGRAWAFWDLIESEVDVLEIVRKAESRINDTIKDYNEKGS